MLVKELIVELQKLPQNLAVEVVLESEDSRDNERQFREPKPQEDVCGVSL